MRDPRGKVVLDTNVFIDFLRAGRHEDWVIGRVEGCVRFLSAVVLMELRLGADTPARRRAVDRIRAAFPAGRIVAPRADLYDRAGEIFRSLRGGSPGAGPSVDRLGAMNDLLIALTAWQMGACVVTGNASDFEHIARHLPGLVWATPS